MNQKWKRVAAENSFAPGYLALYRSGVLQQRVEQALEHLARCDICPRRCGVDRRGGEVPQGTVCRSGRYARVASYFAHRGEEDCLRGWNGSGTIFFSLCNLRCVFCQNMDISQQPAGQEVRPARLAEIMLELQKQGCHNINLVTPEHVVPHFLEALPLAVEQGLRLPIVYNTAAYDSLHSLRLLDGVVDIYMPDFKFWDEKLARRYLKAADYPEVARQALREMQRQVGVLTVDERGLARRGLLVRHLVMPDHTDDSAKIMQFLAEELSPDTYVNIMSQYRPEGRVSADRYAEINRRPTSAEIQRVLTAAQAAGLHRFDRRRTSHFLF